MAIMNLGGLKLASNVILSPLERVSDVGFRRLCFQNGAGLTWTEMIYASDLVRRPGKNEISLSEARVSQRGGRGSNLIDTMDPETLTGVQIIVDRTTARDGWGTDLLKAALEQLEEGASNERPEWNNIVAVDLNFGCPAPALSRRGAGPAQLRRRSKIRALFEVLHEWKKSTSLQSIKAVGAKVRLGNNEREQYYKVYLPVAEAAAENLDYLTVHARHAEQRSRDPPTWDAIREIKESVKDDAPHLKIIGNGDIRTRDDVKKIQEQTGCDGVMIGRAAMRNPWCFRHLNGEDVGESEWPEPADVERSFEENEAYSSAQPADTRYRRFRNENFTRLRHESLRAHNREAVVSSGTKEDTGGDGVHSDWYEEWSKASSRRRHLEKMDDEEMLRQSSLAVGEVASVSGQTPSAGGSWRRTTNQRSWKARKKRKENQKQ